MQVTRRQFVALGLGAGVGMAMRSRGAGGGEPEPLGTGLELIGSVKPVPSAQIQASPLSVGFETLDRKHFDPTRTYAHLAKLGVKWARCQTGWNRCEPARGTFDFAWLDAVVDSLLKIGIQPWFNLGYGNRVYTPKADAAAVGWAPVFDDAAKEAWVRFTRAIAGHFRTRVRHWEIWNEPNISTFWKPRKPNPADYVALVKLTAPEIRQRVPGAVIIGAALAGTPTGYLKGCLDAGLAEHVHRISYHPYRAVPEAGYAAQVAAMRKLLAATGKPIKLWQGENGCPSKGGKGSVGALSNLEWDETRQAKWLLRRILSDLRLGLELTSYFHTIDLVGYRGKTNFKGLLRGTTYEPKPSYRAYQCLCALFDARTTLDPKLTLDLVGQKKVHLQDVGFVRDGRALYAWWLPASLQKGFEPRRISVRLATRPDATLTNPVLIDPLTSRVYRLPDGKRHGGALTFESLPLLDSPLLVADGGVAGWGGPAR